ncbi:MAG: prolyl oligopeptidase family serine peptidase [Bacteroidota bacterium]
MYKLTVFMLLVATITSGQDFNYPVTRKTDQTDTYFGTTIADPYRWLEDDRSVETAEWVKQENITTQEYLSKIPFRNQVKERMTKLWNFPKWSVPFKAGEKYFVYTNNGLQNQFVLNILSDLKGKPKSFLDPNTFSKDGTVNINSTAASKDGKYLAYMLSSAGSDWNEILIKEIATGESLADTVRWVKFSEIAWHGNGFYYSRYEAPDASDVLKGKNEYHKVFYHTLGQPATSDELVFEDKEHPLRNFSASVVGEERFLVISGSEGTSGNNLIVMDLKAETKKFITLIAEFGHDYSVLDCDSAGLLILTNKDASNYKVIRMNPGDTARVFTDIISERKEVLQEAVKGQGLLVAKYLQDAKSVLKVFSLDGKEMYDIPLETIGTVDQLSIDAKGNQLFYSLTTFTSPASIWKYDLNTRKQDSYFRPAMPFNTDDFETEQVFYESYDGTRIPMFIVHKKGMIRDGHQPTLLFGYGGFNISKTPEFKIERLVFLEQGGVFAMPCIRGGGEYGESWHEAGTKLKKQNVFDDFISAANYLIKQNYTEPARLGIGGRSNGGLLVGACMTQRPDLFKVALPAVGVLDMLRYHTFTIGWAWKGDYGSSEDPEQFRYLLGYSPLHNVKKGASYPATLVTTGDHDDRVVPAHSFKFIASLQEKNEGPNPQLIRIDVNAGHAGSTALGSSKPVSKQIEEQTDVYSFLMYNLGMEWYGMIKR